MSAPTRAGQVDASDRSRLKQKATHNSVSSPQQPDRAHIPPIRSLTVREPTRFPSWRTLRHSEGDGQHDSTPPQEQEITKAINRLESLVQQITELAQQPVPQQASKKRRPSENITARGFRYLTSTNPPEPTESPVQACMPAHGQLVGTKAAPAKPLIAVTLADERPPEHTVRPGSAEKKLRQHRTGTKEGIQHPSRPAPPTQTQNHSKSKAKGQQKEPRRHHRKPERWEVAPFEDEEKAFESLEIPRPGHERHFTQMFGIRHNSSTFKYSRSQTSGSHVVDLRRVNHVDLLNRPKAFDVFSSYDHAPIARHWSDSKKRFTATIACLNAACMGLIVGMYSGEVPAIQYVIADFHHYAILGNVFLYCGLAISTFLLWPLPLLHGRKVYTITGLVLALGLQIPQGIALIQYRMPDETTWRTLLLLSRALSGLVLGLVNINIFPTLLDLFGASLQSSHPYGEPVDPYDVRRHGGGMGFWLAAWSWCTIGPIGLGFVMGAFIIDKSSVDWGFWISMMLLIVVLLLNVVTPEPRRAAFRRTLAELLGDKGPVSRVTRGEVKMHLDETGPYWWGEEVQAGMRLSWRMVKQSGFLALAVYTAWVYAQFTLILMLLGALCSRYYRYVPIWVGICALSLGCGALMAVPFQKASVFSRARRHRPRSDSATFERSEFWTSHLVRRTLFTVLLPLAGIGYALTARGPPFPVAIPCTMAAIVGYFSNLATAECFGLVMETFDTSDLQPGMTGKPLRGSLADRTAQLRTNFTCYPRVVAGIMTTQALKFTLAAAATGLGGRMERRIGAMQASGVMAGILMALTFLLTLVLWRWKTVQLIASQRVRKSRAGSVWEPVVLGEPTGLLRKISMLESGRQTRWSEIRRRNRLESRLTAA